MDMGKEKKAVAYPTGQQKEEELEIQAETIVGESNWRKEAGTNKMQQTGARQGEETDRKREETSGANGKLGRKEQSWMGR